LRLTSDSLDCVRLRTWEIFMAKMRYRLSSDRYRVMTATAELARNFKHGRNEVEKKDNQRTKGLRDGGKWS
jgi:hypothetical protein